ncbi:hypothetical protein [Streptomyces glaucus]|uniref:hypothetical protein n=1 Tax=Streptomyces glaucus TaxID=284029 RepID=UPI0031DBF205
MSDTPSDGPGKAIIIRPPPGSAASGISMAIGEDSSPWPYTGSTLPARWIHSLLPNETPTPSRAACACTVGRPGLNWIVGHTLTGTATTTVETLKTCPLLVHLDAPGVPGDGGGR